MVYKDYKKDSDDAIIHHDSSPTDGEESNNFGDDLSGILNNFLKNEEITKLSDWEEYIRASDRKTKNEQDHQEGESRETGGRSQSATKSSKPDRGNSLLDLQERTRREGRARAVTAEIRRVAGNMTIPDHAVVNNSLVVDGRLRVGKGCRIHGNVKALRGIEIGEGTMIDGHVISEGSIVIGKYSVVNGIVDSSTSIVLDEKAAAEAILTDKAIMLGPGARVSRRIASGELIATLGELLGGLNDSTPLDASNPPVTSRSRQSDESFDRDDAESTESKVEIPIHWENLTHGETESDSSELYFRDPIPTQRDYRQPVGGELFIPYEILDVGSDNLYIYAPVRYGKTLLVNRLIIPALKDKRKIITIDSHREYPFDQYVINYDKTIPEEGNELVKTFFAFNVRIDVDNIVKDAIFRVVTDEGDISIVLDVDDRNCEKIIVDELLKRINQIRWSEPVLVVLEDADKYNVSSLLTRGSYSNIQVIMTSWKKIIPGIFFKVRLVLGKVRPEMIGDYDFEAAVGLSSLNKFEFLWEKEFHQWRRFRLEPEDHSYTRAPAYTPKAESKAILKTPEPRPVPTMIQPATTRPKEPKKTAVDETIGKPPEKVSKPEISEREAMVIKFKTAGCDETEIGLRLFMDQVEIRNMLQSLKERGHYKGS